MPPKPTTIRFEDRQDGKLDVLGAENRFRTLRTLPAGTRFIAYRRVNYYPVNGVYYIRHNGVFVRRLPPKGFRIARLTGRLVRLSVRNKAYVFSEGIFYQEVDNEYEIVEAPKGAVLDELPEDVEEMILEDMTAYELLRHVV